MKAGGEVRPRFSDVPAWRTIALRVFTVSHRVPPKWHPKVQWCGGEGKPSWATAGLCCSSMFGTCPPSSLSAPLPLSEQPLTPRKLKCRNTCQLPSPLIERLAFHVPRQLPGSSQASRQVWPATSYLGVTLQWWPILTDVIDTLSHSKLGHVYLGSRQNPFLVITNGNIHHPVLMALKKNKNLTRISIEKVSL